MEKLTIKEVMELPIDTKVYKVTNGKITPMRVLVKNKREDIFYFVSDANYSANISTYIPNDRYDYFTDYVLAKEEMWKQLMENVASINKIYFENTKKFSHE
jgi:hypothetical protein